jgi:hypothetical protein
MINSILHEVMFDSWATCTGLTWSLISFRFINNDFYFFLICFFFYLQAVFTT